MHGTDWTSLAVAIANITTLLLWTEQIETNFWFAICMNTGFISNTQIPEFTTLSGYPILFLCSAHRKILSKESVQTVSVTRLFARQVIFVPIGEPLKHEHKIWSWWIVWSVITKMRKPINRYCVLEKHLKLL